LCKDDLLCVDAVDSVTSGTRAPSGSGGWRDSLDIGERFSSLRLRIVTLKRCAMQINYSLVLNESDTDAVKAAFALYAEKCEAEVEAGNQSPYSSYALKMANLIKSVDEAEAAARELSDLRQGLEATLAHGKT
jgi:hypothetical protein